MPAAIRVVKRSVPSRPIVLKAKELVAPIWPYRSRHADQMLLQMRRGGWVIFFRALRSSGRLGRRGAWLELAKECHYAPLLLPMRYVLRCVCVRRGS